MPSLRKCCISTCYFPGERSVRFPLCNKVLYQKWLEQINDSNLFSMSPKDLYKNVRICTKHFDSKWIKSRDYPGSTRAALHKDAIPSLLLTKEEGVNCLMECITNIKIKEKERIYSPKQEKESKSIVNLKASGKELLLDITDYIKNSDRNNVKINGFIE